MCKNSSVDWLLFLQYNDTKLTKWIAENLFYKNRRTDYKT